MNETPGEALDSWLPAPGSDLYYAHLYAPNGARRALLTIASLRQAIAGIPASCSAPTIALPKLAWWRDELGQLARGTPRHAITRGLIDFDPALPAAGLALVEGVENMLGAPHFPTLAARRGAFVSAHGPLWACALRRCLPAESGVAPEALALAGLVEEIAALRDARPQLECQMALLTDETIAAATRTAGTLPVAAGDWYAAVLGEDLAALRAELARELSVLEGRANLRPLATLARLNLTLVSEILHSGCRVWETRTELTPLRKLWLAWRERFSL